MPTADLLVARTSCTQHPKLVFVCLIVCCVGIISMRVRVCARVVNRWWVGRPFTTTTARCNKQNTAGAPPTTIFLYLFIHGAKGSTPPLFSLVLGADLIHINTRILYHRSTCIYVYIICMIILLLYYYSSWARGAST